MDSRRSRASIGVARRLLVVGSLAIAAPAGAQPPPVGLVDLLRVADEHNLVLEAGRFEWEAEHEEAARSGSWPDPQVTVGWFAESVETRVGPQVGRVMLRQRLPWFGKLGARRDVADGRVAIAAARLDEDRHRIRREVATEWFELWWADRALEITRENIALLTSFENVVRERYRVGTAGHAQLSRLQIEIAQLEDLVLTREDALRPRRATVNALLDRDPSTDVPLPSERPPLPPVPSRAAALTHLAETAPSLRVHDRRLEEARSAYASAKRERWPDWVAGVDWIPTDPALDPAVPDSGRDPWMVSLSVELPIFRGKHDGPVRGAERAARSAVSRRADAESRLEAQVEDVLFRWRDAERREELHASVLIPKAHEMLRATRDAYRTGDASFVNLIEAQQIVLDLELARERAFADRGVAAAELEALTGKPWIEGGAR